MLDHPERRDDQVELRAQVEVPHVVLHELDALACSFARQRSSIVLSRRFP